MLVPVLNNLCGFAQFAFDRVPGANFDEVGFGDKSHRPQAISAIVGYEFVNGVAVIAGGLEPEGLGPALVTRANHEEVFVFPETFVPHLLRSVAA